MSNTTVAYLGAVMWAFVAGAQGLTLGYVGAGLYAVALICHLLIKD